MKIAYFDCFSGISGDMTIAAFLDAGLSMSELSAGLKKLKLDGYRLKSGKVMRGPICGTRFDCVTAGHSRHEHRSLGQILSVIDKSSLGPGVKDLSRRIFENIGAAEARVHGIKFSPSLRLHELAQIDSIVDIVGTAIAVDALGIDEVRSSPITMGRTVVSTMHGAIPVPSPAALELLKGVSAETLDIRSELVTPTGAAIVKTLAKGFGAMGAMKISAVGYGAGSREEPRLPNMLRVVIGEKASGLKNDTVRVVEANIDDMNPQYFEYVFEKLFEAGALDVYLTPIQMKKARPAFKLSAICHPDKMDGIVSSILRETTTIGVRYYEADRFILERETLEAKTRYGNVRVKVSGAPGGVATSSPEYEDCARIARSKRVSLKSVYEAAKAAVKTKGTV